MKWKIEFEKHAAKELKNLEHEAAKSIVKFLTRLEKIEDPRLIGEALKGSSLGAFWKYRVGDYRLIAHIKDHTLTIVVVRIGHPREVYR